MPHTRQSVVRVGGERTHATEVLGLADCDALGLDARATEVDEGRGVVFGKRCHVQHSVNRRMITARAGCGHDNDMRNV